MITAFGENFFVFDVPEFATREDGLDFGECIAVELIVSDFGVRGEVGGDNDIVEGEEWVGEVGWFVDVDVETGAGDAFGA